ncbi:hypothetical protein [Kribbella sp. HUAS MG21]|uniref:Uncharacterized protein n=1 Tax=Kribbella sp. HUAS MG21 TaxID=3160966 RepID=A0AAU7T7J6_9ACTN
MQLATVLVIAALVMAALGVVAAVRHRLILSSALIVGGLVLGLGSTSYLD